jgi:hypothetical protein
VNRADERWRARKAADLQNRSALRLLNLAYRGGGAYVTGRSENEQTEIPVTKG